ADASSSYSPPNCRDHTCAPVAPANLATTMSFVPLATSAPPPKLTVPTNRPATTTSPFRGSTASPSTASSPEPPRLLAQRTAPDGEYFTTKPSELPALDSVAPPRSGRPWKFPPTNTLPAASVARAKAPSPSDAPIFFDQVAVPGLPVTAIV